MTATKLAPLTQVETTTSDPVVDGATGAVTALCPDGTTVISGGGFPSTFEMSLTTSIRMGNGWRSQSTNHTGTDQTVTARAYCLAAAPPPPAP